MRLIDADYFKEQIAKATLKGNIEPKKGLALMELVDAQPTAYDVGKTLENLKEYTQEAEEFNVSGMLADIMEEVKIGGYK